MLQSGEEVLIITDPACSRAGSPNRGRYELHDGNPAQPLINGLFKTALSLFRGPVMGKFADGDAASGRDHGFLARLDERGLRAYGFAQK